LCTTCSSVQGTIVTLAGTGAAGSTGDGGPASVAQLNGPTAVAVDAQGNVYISEVENKAVRQVQAGTRTMSTIAGGATSTQLSMPVGLAVDVSGNVYISDMVLF
jgi:DNA-binding beta-propeller fold protein YncE